MIYRVFPMRLSAGPGDPGGPLHAPRSMQGPGRHDNPDAYGALYASDSPVSAIAESIARFRGQRLPRRYFGGPDGVVAALAQIDDSAVAALADLDDPRELAARRLRPSQVATAERERTQRIALDLCHDDLVGFRWWSTLEASWINSTLFAERAMASLTVVRVDVLDAQDRNVQVAARLMGVRITEVAG